MAELTHKEYDFLERAVVDGSRIAIQRRGRREYVVIPLALKVYEGREAIETRNPVTGHDLTIFLDEIERVEPVE
jgi:hypothetical protein